jgi:hypothetical protein
MLLVLACTPAILVDEVVGPPCEARAAFYRDADGDGAGDPLTVAITCAAPDGYVATAGDCDDADPARAASCGDTGSRDTGSTDTGSTGTGT